MLYSSCCVLHTPCACTYDNLLASQDVFIQLDRSRSPTMPCILLVIHAAYFIVHVYVPTITCLLFRTYIHLMSTTQLEHSRLPTMPCILLVSSQSPVKNTSRSGPKKWRPEVIAVSEQHGALDLAPSKAALICAYYTQYTLKNALINTCNGVESEANASSPYPPSHRARMRDRGCSGHEARQNARAPVSRWLSTHGTLLNVTFDIVERETTEQPTAALPMNLSPSMRRNSGKPLAFTL